MSHFTVTVALPGTITDLQSALEEALRPFDEALNVEPYIGTSAQEITEDTHFQLYREQHPTCTPVAWYGGELDDEGNILTTYNPDAHWDWWVIGGRWGGYWTLKPELALAAVKGLTQTSSFGMAPEAADPHRADVARVAAVQSESMKPTHAVLDLDGRWTERGNMGWFGAARDEQPAVTWEAEYLTWITALPADTWLVLVDAHI